MLNQNQEVKGLQEPINTEISKPINARERNIQNAVEREWSIEILKGEVNGKTQLAISIQSRLESSPSFYKYADFMSASSPKQRKIEENLMNRGGLGRADLPKIEIHIEKLIKDQKFKEVNDMARLLSQEDTQEFSDLKALEAQAEEYFDIFVEYVNENIEIFPKRNIDKDAQDKQGYSEDNCLGVYITDKEGIKKYGSEAVAILPRYLQEVLDITNTQKLGGIFNIWVNKGYLYFNTKSVDERKDKPVKFQYGIPARRAYVFTSPRLKREGE